MKYLFFLREIKLDVFSLQKCKHPWDRIWKRNTRSPKRKHWPSPARLQDLLT